MGFKFSERSKSRMAGVHPELVLVFHEALAVSPIDFGIPEHGGLRSAEEQHSLFLDNKSKADGYNKLSNHQSGNALDFYAYLNGAASWDKVHLAMVAATILSTAARLKEQGKISISIRWGGTFGNKGRSFHGWDYPHMEVINA